MTRDQLLFASEILFRNLGLQERIFEKRREHCLELQDAYRREHGEAVPEPLPVEEIEGSALSSAEFLKRSRGLTRPVVIRGLMRKSAACQTWGMDYFEERFGSCSYPVLTDTHEVDPGAEEVDMEMRTVSELLEGARRGDGAYLNNLSIIFHDHPVLLEELEISRLLQPIGDIESSSDCFDVANLFIGGGGTKTPMHCAFGGNFFCNIVGKKHWLLVDPAYTAYLLPEPARPFIFASVTFDPGEPTVNDFTKLLPSQSVLMEEGDVLFNPPWWWHRVENRSDFTVGAAVRRLSFANDYRTNFLFTALSVQGVLSTFKALYELKLKITGSSGRFRDLLQRDLDKPLFKSFEV